LNNIVYCSNIEKEQITLIGEKSDFLVILPSCYNSHLKKIQNKKLIKKVGESLFQNNNKFYYFEKEEDTYLFIQIKEKLYNQIYKLKKKILFFDSLNSTEEYYFKNNNIDIELKNMNGFYIEIFNQKNQKNQGQDIFKIKREDYKKEQIKISSTNNNISFKISNVLINVLILISASYLSFSYLKYEKEEKRINEKISKALKNYQGSLKKLNIKNKELEKEYTKNQKKYKILSILLNDSKNIKKIKLEKDILKIDFKDNISSSKALSLIKLLKLQFEIKKNQSGFEINFKIKKQ